MLLAEAQKLAEEEAKAEAVANASAAREAAEARLKVPVEFGFVCRIFRCS